MSRPGALLFAVLFCGCALGKSGFKDDFSSYRDLSCVPDDGRLGRWTVASTGFGCVTAADGRLEAGPQPSAEPGSTHAVLITGPRFSTPLSFSVRVQTARQLRVGSPANPWETAWVVWGYQDRKHFYYFMPRPSGWELGKRDPAFRGGQRFLENGTTPTFPLGSWAAITITQDRENKISVFADGKLVTTFFDQQRPYAKGRIGLYGEDCLVRFKDVAVR